MIGHIGVWCRVLPHWLLSHMSMSSTTTSTPSMSSNISDIMVWKMSCAEQMPKGSLLNIYRPNGVLNVHSLQLSRSSLTCQNPELASRTEKYLALGIRATISSTVLMG